MQDRLQPARAGREQLVARRSFPPDRLEAFLALKTEVDPDGLFSTDLWRRVFEGDPDGTSHGPVAGPERVSA